MEGGEGLESVRVCVGEWMDVGEVRGGEGSGG